MWHSKRCICVWFGALKLQWSLFAGLFGKRRVRGYARHRVSAGRRVPWRASCEAEPFSSCAGCVPTPQRCVGRGKRKRTVTHPCRLFRAVSSSEDQQEPRWNHPKRRHIPVRPDKPPFAHSRRRAFAFPLQHDLRVGVAVEQGQTGGSPTRPPSGARLFPSPCRQMPGIAGFALIAKRA